MSRLKIASAARQANLQVFASLPEETRVATVLDFLTRLAFSKDNALSLGVTALHAMVKAGIKGNVFEYPMTDIEEMVKKRSPKLNKIGESFGKALLNKGLKRYKSDLTSIHGETLDSLVTQRVMETLLSRNPLRPGTDVPQVVTYLQTMIWTQASTIVNSPDFKFDRYKPEDLAQNVDEFMSNPRNWTRMPSKDLRKLLDKLKTDPIMQDTIKDQTGATKTIPKMLLFVQGLIQGHSLRSIAQSMGYSAGGHAPLMKWVREPQRMKRLRMYLEPLL